MNKFPCSTRAAEQRRCGELESYVVYFSCWLVISGRAPGHGPEGSGNCSSCYEAQANLKVNLVKLKVKSQAHRGGGTETQGRSRRIEERIAPRSALGCRCAGLGAPFASIFYARAGAPFARGGGPAGPGRPQSLGNLRQVSLLARRDVGGDGGRRGDRGSRGFDQRKQREGSVHQLQQATGRWPSGGLIEQAGCAWRQECEELTNHIQIGIPTAGRTETRKSANQQRRVPISNRRTGLELLCEWDVSWKESRYEMRQEVTGASVTEVLLLPAMSRNERA